jgi:thiol-disulfide isomerase/thioredoxin
MSCSATGICPVPLVAAAKSASILRNRPMRDHQLWLSLLGLALVAGCGTQAGETKTETSPGAPDRKAEKKVELKTLSAEETFALIKKKAGKVVIVDCWSTYCEPCMKEFPGLLKLQEKYGDRVACISVSLNFNSGKVEDERPAVLEFLEKQKATIDNVLSSTADEDFFKALKAAYKLTEVSSTVPLVLLLDKEGKVAGHWSSKFTYAKNVEPEVEKLLK